MRESSLVPTTLLDWTRVVNLLSEQKLIYMWCWASPYTSSVGVGTIPPRPAAATVGLSEEAFVAGMQSLVAAELIQIDDKTREVYVLDWFRFHRFATARQRGIANQDLSKIRSAAITQMVLVAASNAGVKLTAQEEKQPLRTPTATGTGTRTGTLSASCTRSLSAARTAIEPLGCNAAANKRFEVIGGVQCWDKRDANLAAELIEQWGGEAVSRAVVEVVKQGLQPLPSRVAKVFTDAELLNGSKKNQRSIEESDRIDISALGRLGAAYLYPNRNLDPDSDLNPDPDPDLQPIPH